MNVYDFDKTIYDGDSTVDFYLYCIKKHPKLILDIPKQIINMGLYLIGKYDKTKLKEKFYSFLKKITNVDEDIKEFWNKNKTKIKKIYKDKRQESDIIISASPYFLLEPICKEIGIRKLIASDVNKATGKYNGKNCYGEEKVNRFYKEYPNEKIEEFYSDSLSDEPLANIAKSAFIVHDEYITKWEEYKPSILQKAKTIFFDKSFILFILVGMINTINGIVASFLYSLVIKSANLAFIIGYITSLIISYVLNSIITFKEKLQFTKLVKFCISYIPNFVIQNIVVFIIFNLLNWNKLIAYVMAAIIGLPVTFILMKIFAFKKK